MKEQALSPAERCPALSVDSKPLGVLDIRDTLEVLFRAGKMSGGAAIQHVDRPTPRPHRPPPPPAPRGLGGLQRPNIGGAGVLCSPVEREVRDLLPARLNTGPV